MTDTKAHTYPILFTFAQHYPLSTLVARGRGVAGLLAPETVLFAAPTQHLELRGLFACVSGESGVRVKRVRMDVCIRLCKFKKWGVSSDKF